MIATPKRTRDGHQLQCMEIWGGNRAVEDAVSVFGIDAWVLSLPHAGGQQGGDIHYVSMCGSGRIARFIVADVAGHGNAAAGLAVVLRNLMKKHINRLDQTRFARDLNREFGLVSKDGSFATAVLATYFAPTGHLILCNAGHPPPLWYRTHDRRWMPLVPTMPEQVNRVRNLPLGVIEPTDYQQFAVSLSQGDLVLLYTDSLIEAANPAGVRLGLDELLSILTRLDGSHPERFNREILLAVRKWASPVPLDDDTTLLLLRHNGTRPSWPSLTTTVKVLGKLVGLLDY
ncbi:MAG: PP2C family protein-serine/threonine phosphatase [Phycisphaerae bacterium]